MRSLRRVTFKHDSAAAVMQLVMIPAVGSISCCACAKQNFRDRALIFFGSFVQGGVSTVVTSEIEFMIQP